MNNREKKTKTVRIRLTQSEYTAVCEAAQIRSSSVSNVIRDALFNQHTESCASIKTELVKQKMYNLIQHTKMSTESRKNLVKELNSYDEGRY